MRIFKDMFEVMKDNTARYSTMRDVLTTSMVAMLNKPDTPPHFKAMAKKIEASETEVFLLVPMRDAELLVAHNTDDPDTLVPACLVRDALQVMYQEQGQHILLKVW